MLNTTIISSLINDITYELDLRYFGQEYGSYANTSKVSEWHRKVKNDHAEVFASKESAVSIAMSQIEALLIEEEGKNDVLPTSELKYIFSRFMAGELNPKIREWSEKRGTIILEETGAVARTNSAADKQDLFDSVRSRAYIDNLVEKYKPVDAEELLYFFDRA